MEGMEKCHETVFSACEHGCPSCLKMLLEKGEPTDGRNNLGWRPLHVAAYKNHLSCLELLLAQLNLHIDDSSRKGETALMVAIMEGHIQVCETLLRAGASPNVKDLNRQPPLKYAIDNDRKDLVEILCNHGADPNAVDNAYDYMLNCAAARYDTTDVAIVEILLEKGANVRNVTWSGFNALMSALKTNNIRVFDILLNYAVKNCTQDEIHVLVNQCSKSTTEPAFPPQSLLVLAARLLDPKPVSKLLKLGANPNAQVCSAIFWSLRGHLDCLKLLLPPVTDLAKLEFAHYPQEGYAQCNKCILVAAVEADLRPNRNDGSKPGDRLRLLLQSGLHSIVNVKRTRYHSYSLPIIASWPSVPDGPRSMSTVLSDQLTTLTRMVMHCADIENLKVMIENGANWKFHSGSHTETTASPYFFTNDAETVETLSQTLDTEFYHPDFTFNLNVLALFMFQEALQLFLNYGAECQSCFDPRIDDISADAWTFEKVLKWLKMNVTLLPFFGSANDPSSVLHDFVDASLQKSLKILLNYTSVHGRRQWILGLIDDPSLRRQLADKMAEQFTLKHTCRMVIRKALKRISRDPVKQASIVRKFDLPVELKSYLTMAYSRCVT